MILRAHPSNKKSFLISSTVFYTEKVKFITSGNSWRVRAHFSSQATYLFFSVFVIPSSKMCPFNPASVVLGN